MRITGIVSGFDTDQMVKDLMKAESMKMNRVKQSKQYVEWQQETYREFISEMRNFQSSFFDVLKPSTNLTSTSSFSKFNYGISSNGVASSAVSITATSRAAKAVTINKIDQLATKDTWTGANTGIRGINTEGLDLTSLGTNNLEFNLAIGSNAKTITLTNAEVSGLNSTALAAAINSKIAIAFGSDYAGVASGEGAELKFDFAGSEVKILEASNPESMTALGLTSGVSSYGYKTKSVAELFNITGIDMSAININGKTIALSGTDTIESMNKKLNDAGAGFEISYNTVSDKFSMSSTKEGSANDITLGNGDTENLMNVLFGPEDIAFDPNVPNYPKDETKSYRIGGLNAKLTINGESVIQGSNSFVLDGITFDLKSTSVDPIDVKIDVNTDAIVENIKNFVTEYNKMIDSITTKLTEKRDYNYKPLTDDERDALSDDEIEKWEIKAKLGNMGNATELNTMLTRLRNAIIEPIEGSTLTLNQIGISSTSYSDRGKLTVDEDKLRLALENNYDEVVSVFTKQSEFTYSDSANSEVRYKENGIAARFNDILNDNVRVNRDANGNKGILLQKAGMENDSSVFTNALSAQIKNYDTRIDKLIDMLNSRENYYYSMFSKIETALSRMESQSSSLMSMLGGTA